MSPLEWLKREGRGRHGVQLAVAVVAAYVASAALGLPESLWAVMSAVIVVRPNTGTTLTVGWMRLAGTVIGSAGGFAGVWLRHHGASMPGVTLAVVATLAFASAIAPVFASAPIAALIILSSAEMPGHSALQVAALRGVEVGIGVVVGVLVSALGRGVGASARFNAECSQLLKYFAATLRGNLDADGEANIRSRLRMLAVIAHGADTESKWFGRARGEAARHHRKLAGLTVRVHQDVSVLARLLPKRGAVGQPTLAIALASLDRAVGAFDGQVAFEAPDATGSDSVLIAPLKLLIGDLGALAGSAQAEPLRAPPS